MPSLPDRPTVLTPEAQRIITNAVAEGSHLSVACRAAGITYSNFAHWRKRCEEGDETAQRFADFFDDIKRASSVAEIMALSKLKEGEQGWQSLAWFLERRFPDRWGKRDKVEHSTPSTGKPVFAVTVIRETAKTAHRTDDQDS